MNASLTTVIFSTLTLIALGGIAGYCIASGKSNRPIQGPLHIHLTLKVLNRLSVAPDLSGHERASIEFLKEYLVSVARAHDMQSIQVDDAKERLAAFHSLASWYEHGNPSELHLLCQSKTLRCDVRELLYQSQEMLRAATEDGHNVVTLEVSEDGGADQLLVTLQIASRRLNVPEHRPERSAQGGEGTRREFRLSGKLG